MRAVTILALSVLLAVIAFAGPIPAVQASATHGLQSSATRLSAGTRSGVVYAVMFWMAGCGHCEEVLTNVLPALQSEYGDGFEVLLIQLEDQASLDRLFQTAEELGLAKEDVAVPFLIVGRSVLIGSGQIPEELPGIIDAGLASGGIPFPELDSLADLAPAGETGGEISPPVLADPAPSPTPIPLGRDPAASNKAGFAIAWGVMVLLVLSVLYTIYGFLGGPLVSSGGLQSGATWLIPLLIGIGLVIASYLSYVELARVEAFCGPIGDCNTVQSSRYAKLFGIIPMGLFGTAGYLAMLAGWVWPLVRNDRLARIMPLLVFAAALFGVLFSIYLTYIELFVLRAVCAWCLANAVVMPLLLAVTTPAALRSLEGTEPPD